MECLYCGAECLDPDKEHIPPRSFLEKPYPPRLRTVTVCSLCNRQFSKDEQYAVAFMTLTGMSDVLNAKNEVEGSVDRAFRRRPAFEERFLDRLKIDDEGRVYLEPESERLHSVLKKVVCGLYWLRYKHRLPLNSIGPITVLPHYGEAPSAQLVGTPQRLQWEVVQQNVFEFAFLPQENGSTCLINWHNNMLILCGVPSVS